jgi:hypothetical protein
MPRRLSQLDPTPNANVTRYKETFSDLSVSTLYGFQRLERDVMRKSNIVMAIAGLWLAACGNGLDGTWENTTGLPPGTVTLTFESSRYSNFSKNYSTDSTGNRTFLGTTTESGTYTLSASTLTTTAEALVIVDASGAEQPVESRVVDGVDSFCFPNTSFCAAKERTYQANVSGDTLTLSGSSMSGPMIFARVD